MSVDSQTWRAERIALQEKLERALAEVCRLAQSAELLTNLAQLYRAGHGADCGLVGGGTGQQLLPRPCHRLILAAASPFLASLIQQVEEVKS